MQDTGGILSPVDTVQQIHMGYACRANGGHVTPSSVLFAIAGCESLQRDLARMW